MFPRPTHPARRLRGFTLIELLVVVAIVAVLTVLLLAWTRSSREDARRAVCQSNLKQLAVAARKYAQVWNGLLAPSGDAKAGLEKSVNDFSMKVRLLPFLEHNAIYNGVNFDFPSPSTENLTSATTAVLLFSCPADDNDPGSMVVIVGEPPAKVGSTSYPNNIGTFLGNHGGNLDGPSFVFNAKDDAPARLFTEADITDGLAKTVLFGEFVKGKGQTDTPGSHQTYAMAKVGYAGPTTPIDLAAAVADCRAATAIYQQPAGTNWDRKGEWWTVGNCGQGGGYSHVNTPNTKAGFFKGAGLAPHYSMIGASSNHAGGVNVVFLDGASRFIADSIDVAVWRALATRAGGDVHKPGDY